MADHFLSYNCGLEGYGRIPVCWINKEKIKSELRKNKDVESEKEFDHNKECSNDLDDKHFNQEKNMKKKTHEKLRG